MAPTCSRCGTPADVADGRRADDAADGTLPLGWSLGTEPGGRVERICPTCARENIRAIEAKLPGEYW